MKTDNTFDSVFLKAGLLVLAIFALCFISTVSTVSASTDCANGVEMTNVEMAVAVGAGKVTTALSRQGGTVVAHIVNSTNCNLPLSVSSYKVFEPLPALSSQQFIDSISRNIGGNTTVDMPVSVAACKTQVDIWYKDAPHYLYTGTRYDDYQVLPFAFNAMMTAEDYCTTCTIHSTKQCSGNAVYWYNSCGVKEDPFQVCTSNQTCLNAQCINLNIACNTNSACGTNGYVGLPFCQNGDVYQNYRTYTCNNPGTVNSTCTNSTNAQLKTNCTSNQTCSNGSCSTTPTPTPTIACSTNAQCGNNSLTGNPFCQGNNVFTNQLTYYCNNPGTSQSFCSNSLTPQLTQTCSPNQNCVNGSCTSQKIACLTNSQCGINAYTGSPFCQNGDVYQNYRTYICNNPGTVNSACSDSTAPQLKSDCTGNQTCSNGSCSGTNCTYHSYQQCSGNYLYWYDSCGVQQDSQYCSNGCANNSCSNQQNSITVQTNSATNTYNNQATLNGYLSGINTNNTNYVWFQWGTTTSYGYNGYETSHQTMNYTGSFSQNITGISPGVVYHFRAVAQGYNGQIVYGQDMTFQIGQVLGATDVNTGFTNNFLVDSFFLPLMVALAGVWLFKSGILNTGAWVDGKKMKHKDYIANKELTAKISEIKSRENR